MRPSIATAQVPPFTAEEVYHPFQQCMQREVLLLGFDRPVMPTRAALQRIGVVIKPLMWNGLSRERFAWWMAWLSGARTMALYRWRHADGGCWVEVVAASGGGRAGWVARRAGAAWIGWPPR
jgi:hypothetical protein